MRRALKRSIWPGLIFIGLQGQLLLQAQPLQRYTFSHPQMGTTFRLICYARHEALAEEAAQRAFARLDSLNKHLSDYLPESELNRVSHSSGTGRKVKVSPDLWRVLAKSQALARSSKGAFDITVGPLTRLWRRAMRQDALPTRNRLRLARKRVGYRKLRLFPRTRQVKLSRSGMRLDLGGIAKGYAVDEMAKVLHRFGLNQFLVDGGGDLYLGESPPGEAGWRVAFSQVQADSLSMEIRYLSHCGVATSGDQYRYLETDGKRYSHILNPRTGMGMTHRSLVSVIAPTCMEADALASGLSVLGPKQGHTWTRKVLDDAPFFFRYIASESTQQTPTTFFQVEYAEP